MRYTSLVLGLVLAGFVGASQAQADGVDSYCAKVLAKGPHAAADVCSDAKKPGHCRRKIFVQCRALANATVGGDQKSSGNQTMSTSAFMIAPRPTIGSVDTGTGPSW